MKKLITLFVAVALIASLGAVSVFAGHVSRDQVHAYSETAADGRGADLAGVGNNEPVTELGDISDKELEAIVLWGWYANEYPFQEYGYSVNGAEPVFGFEKYMGADASVIGEQAAGQGWADGESARFLVKVPVYVGEDVEVTLVALDEDGEVIYTDWTVVYTNTYGEEAAPEKPTPAPTEEPTPTPEVTEAPKATDAPKDTEAPKATEAPKEEGGCGSVIGGSAAILAVMAVSALVLRKKESK